MALVSVAVGFGQSLTMRYGEFITVEPGKRGGKACIRRLRLNERVVRTICR
jgi:uncharacterized protein (DUF433 family)